MGSAPQASTSRASATSYTYTLTPFQQPGWAGSRCATVRSTSRSNGMPNTTVTKMYRPDKKRTRQHSEMCLPQRRPTATSSSCTHSLPACCSPLVCGTHAGKKRQRALFFLRAVSTRRPPGVRSPRASQPTIELRVARKGGVKAAAAPCKRRAALACSLLHAPLALEAAPTAPCAFPSLALSAPGAAPGDLSGCLAGKCRWVKRRSSVRVWCVAATATLEGSLSLTPDRLQNTRSDPSRPSASRWCCITTPPISLCTAPPLSSAPPTNTNTREPRWWQSRAVAARLGNVCPDCDTIKTTVPVSRKLLRLRLPWESRRRRFALTALAHTHGTCSLTSAANCSDTKSDTSMPTTSKSSDLESASTKHLALRRLHGFPRIASATSPVPCQSAEIRLNTDGIDRMSSRTRSLLRRRLLLLPAKPRGVGGASC
mmetsp:Transcript_91006/g.181511  ORF Transcript_91006/g.181511 Transcript_91006/m.181511 type:complete len:428 (-) Transcript_91006:574-1857(-)